MGLLTFSVARPTQLTIVYKKFFTRPRKTFTKKSKEGMKLKIIIADRPTRQQSMSSYERDRSKKQCKRTS